MPIRITKTVILLLGILAVSSCEMAQRSSQKASVTDLSMQATTNQNQQINRAIVLLEKGKNKEAEALIDEVLIFNPHHPGASKLKQQLKQDLKNIFGTNKTTKYQIQEGDSLGQIAQHWLGDSVYFVSLARFNKISNPSKLKVGSWIKIPLVKQGKSILKQRSRSSANIGLLKDYRSKKQFDQGLQKANSLFVIPEDMSRLLSEQKLILKDYVASVESIDEMENMAAKVTKIAETSRNRAQRNIYQQFIKNVNIQLFTRQAITYFERKYFFQSAEKLVSAKRLDKTVARDTKIFRMQSLLINKLHEKAVILYRNHELDEALNYWEVILELNPEHALAKKYQQRTNTLLKKLNQY
ncbi:LysM peptidoglycan-binding domain-containing protein [Aliikangiella sp. G2MR2-5]|uniref:LysM peptidoglycan-binding domain-containing protein n=1 Tax=Aliikangiella sp. G2MR2-5 TaxID=2788943 RepID=UPI0018AAF29D|nr:LysM domain-containing protein [Aliikangiella sp. G2MR2-5]